MAWTLAGCCDERLTDSALRALGPLLLAQRPASACPSELPEPISDLERLAAIEDGGKRFVIRPEIEAHVGVLAKAKT